jgi:hypothetical protein
MAFKHPSPPPPWELSKGSNGRPGHSDNTGKVLGAGLGLIGILSASKLLRAELTGWWKVGEGLWHGKQR